jgi:hypothetical protein
MLRYVLAALLGLLSTHAQAGAFDKWLTPDGPTCFPVADIEKVATEKKALKTPTFRFVQALYAAMPPMNRDLPPGDRAELIIGDDGTAVFLLIDDEQACGRFQAPDFLSVMIMKVDDGEFTHSGKPL